MRRSQLEQKPTADLRKQQGVPPGCGPGEPMLLFNTSGKNMPDDEGTKMSDQYDDLDWDNGQDIPVSGK